MALTQSTKATTTVTQVVKIKPKTLQKLRASLSVYANLKAQLDLIKGQMDSLKEEIGELRESTGEDKLAVDGFSIALVQAVRKELDHAKLIQLGCAAAWIAEATVNKPTRPYEKITCPGAKED